MVNSGEVPIKAVMFVKPKLLIGLDQKGKWPGAGSQHCPATDDAPPAKRHDLNPASGMQVNEVSPQSSDRIHHCGGQRCARNAHGAAGKG
jgi:hypothetical protein